MSDWKLLAAVGCGVLMMGVGCADNESSIFIRQVVAPSESDCSYAPDPSGAFFSTGVWDVALASEYRAGVLIGNQLVGRGSAENVRVETARFRAEGAEVRVETPEGDSYGEGSEFTVPVSGFADPGTGTEPGWGVFGVVLVNYQTAGQLAGALVGTGSVARIVSVVKIFGKTLGGQELESGEFRYPIEVCHGCLVSFPPEAVNVTVSPPTCLGGDTEGGGEAPCLVGQEGVLDCRACHAMGYPADICDP